MYKAINTGVRIIQAAYFLISIGEYVAAKKRQIQARKEAKAEAERIFQDGLIGVIFSMHGEINKHARDAALSRCEADLRKHSEEAMIRRNNDLEKIIADLKRKLKDLEPAEVKE